MKSLSTLGWREVQVGGSLIRVSLSEPIAVVRRRGEPDLVVTWPDLPVGLFSPTVRVEAASSGAWVLYTPMEVDEGQGTEEGTAAIHISAEGVIVRFPDLTNVSLLGTTRHGLWLSAGPWDADADIAADWIVDRSLLVLDAVDGTRHLTIDRVTAGARDDGSTPQLVVYASAPDALHDGDGGISYTYRFRQLELPPGNLPAVIRTDEYPGVSLEEDEVPGMMGDDPETCPSTPDDPRADWTMVELSSEQIQAATEVVCSEVSGLDSYWEAAGGFMMPLTDGLSDARLEITGAWPHTRVEVSFRHPHYPQGRLRRTFRVFDDAGRIFPTQFASIHLMEDLDTGALPPATSARDGILDI